MIAVLGDTHLPRGSRRLPEDCVRVLEHASLIVHTGDFTSLAVLEELRALAPVLAVHGNVDEPALRAELPERATGAHDGLTIAVVHDPGPAGGRHDRLRSWFPSADVIAYGHTHAPEVARAGETWVVNPGSPTERRRAPHHTFAVVRERAPELVRL